MLTCFIGTVNSDTFSVVPSIIIDNLKNVLFDIKIMPCKLFLTGPYDPASSTATARELHVTAL
jgi:hypothetical protein